MRTTPLGRRRPTALAVAAVLGLPGLVALSASPAAAQTPPDDQYDVLPGQVSGLDVLGNDGAGDSATGTVTMEPEHGTLETGAAGVFGRGKDVPVYTPDPGFTGLDQFSYTGTRVVEGSAMSYEAVVSIDVQETELCGDASAPEGFVTTVVPAPADGAADTATVTVTVPAGVEEVVLDLCGARGGAAPGESVVGSGATTTAVLDLGTGPSTTVTSFDVVAGAVGTTTGRAFGGGGAAAGGGGGGGASAVYLSGSGDPLLVAGGGGGSASCVFFGPFTAVGGAGGGQTASSGSRCPDFGTPGSGGGGATSTTPGTATAPAQPGQAGQGGDGANGGGGGGGGLFGGGGGSAGGGGGGSGFIAPAPGLTGSTQTGGIPGSEQDALPTGRLGAGSVRISYLAPVLPSFVQGPQSTATVGRAYSSSVVVSGTPTATITLTSGALPAGLTLGATSDGAAPITGTPTAAGTATFTLTATSAAGSTSQVYTITVSPATTTTPGGPSGPDPSPVSPSPVSPSPVSPSPVSPSPVSPSPGSPSPSTGPPSPSPSPTAGSCQVRTTTEVERATIVATGATQVTVRTAPNSIVELLAYTRPSTTYRVVRSAEVDASGVTTFTVTPPANTRLFARGLGCTGDSVRDSVVLNVRTALSLAATRLGVQRYRFSGDSLPARPGGLVVSLYRVTASGAQVLAAQTRASATTGEWRIDRTFTGTGRFGFLVRTGQDLRNAPGSSNVRSTLVF